MKKLSIFLIIVLLSFTLSSCGELTELTNNLNNLVDELNDSLGEITNSLNDELSALNDELNALNDELAQNEWPDNQFTKLVTKPDFEITAVDVTIIFGLGACKINFANVTFEQLEAYAQTLKADGFKYHVDEDTDMTGTYTFRAGNVENGDGYMVVLGPDVFEDGMYLEILSSTFE